MYNILSMAELPRSAETLKNPLYDSAVEPPSPGNIYTAQNPLVYRFCQVALNMLKLENKLAQ